jgi:hypothetical protein
MYHLYQFHRAEFLQHYHKRSNVESIFSMIKAIPKVEPPGLRARALREAEFSLNPVWKRKARRRLKKSQRARCQAVGRGHV